MLTMYCLRTIRTVFLPLRFDFFSLFVLITLMIILTTCVCSVVLLQTATSVKILGNRSINTAESRHTENTFVNIKQVEMSLTTVSNDEKPMPFLHSNISFGTLIRKQAFHTWLSRILHPCILVPHFPILHFPSLHFWPSRIFRSRIFSRPGHVTHDSDTTFKVNLQGAGAYCGGLPQACLGSSAAAR